MLLNFAKSNIIEVEHSMWEASKSMQKTTDEEMVEKIIPILSSNTRLLRRLSDYKYAIILTNSHSDEMNL